MCDSAARICILLELICKDGMWEGRNNEISGESGLSPSLLYMHVSDTFGALSLQSKQAKQNATDLTSKVTVGFSRILDLVLLEWIYEKYRNGGWTHGRRWKVSFASWLPGFLLSGVCVKRVFVV